VIAYDILLGADGDLPIDAGALQLGRSDNQHITDCMLAFPGWWKQFPQNGIGLPIFYKAKVMPGVVLNKVKTQLGNDGYTLKNPTVTVNNGILEVSPNAVRL
jgi:hypothetical protein